MENNLRILIQMCINATLDDVFLFMRYLLLFIWILSFKATTAQWEQENVELIGHWDSAVPPPNGSEAKYNEAWGFTINGEEFAVIGSTLGTHIIWIKSSSALQEVAFIEGGASADYVVHRDFCDYGGFLYSVCDQEPSQLQIIDIRNLPESATLVTDTNQFFTTAHNIVADVHTGKIYACGSSSANLVILDASIDPANPTLLSEFNDAGYVHDVYVRRDTAFLHNGNAGMFVVNFENTTEPQFLGTLEEYPDKGYNHSGWLNADGSIYVFADETDGKRMKVCDVTDLSDIQVLSTFIAPGNPETMAHNVMIKDNLVYVSHYFDGLEIFDISDPSNPVRFGYFDTYRETDTRGRGAWGIYCFLPSGKILISDRQTGLYVFKINEGHLPVDGPQLQVFPNPGYGNLIINMHAFDFEEALLSIYDYQGKLVHDAVLNSDASSLWYEVDLSNHSSGIYTIRAEINNSVYSLKYLKIDLE